MLAACAELSSYANVRSWLQRQGLGLRIAAFPTNDRQLRSHSACCDCSSVTGSERLWARRDSAGLLGYPPSASFRKAGGGGGSEGTAMSTELITTPLPPPRAAWNKGRIVGQKRPLQPKHVWSIRIRLEMSGDLRDLALFNMAIDSKLRGCDLVRLQVRDVFAAGQVRERASVIQQKTGRPVRFAITETTRTCLKQWIASPAMTGMQYLWPSRFHDIADIRGFSLALTVCSIGAGSGPGQPQQASLPRT